jgi:non-specific serine/threonine protein kinase
MTSLVGQRISHYQIFERIGSGGMGVLYKARDVRLDRIVALKFLPPETTRDPDAKQRFVKEARAASALQHTNICVIHDIEEAKDEQMFISMEFYEGETLDKRIACGPLPIQEALDIAIQAADGLTRAHEAGMVHRDIKPGNIMLTSRGEVKILDFGLAKLSSTTDPVETGTTSGTVAYMSPEQARGKAMDHRSDIWSLGAVLYEMVTGQPPFKGEFQNAIVHLILHAQPETMTGQGGGVPEELQQIVEKALAKDPSDRYQNADEILTDLRIVQKLFEAESSRPPEVQLPTQRPSFLRRPVGLLLGLTAIALVVLGLIWLVGRSEEQTGRDLKDRSIAVLPFTSITSSEDDRIFAEGIHDDILSHLAKIRSLKVLGRQSVRRYRDLDLQPGVIADELGVTYLLEGSVRRVADSIRIVAQLLKGETGEHIWAETYDREYAAVFSIQTDVAQQVAHEIDATLTAEEKAQIEHTPTQNLEAYEYYLRGNHYASNYWTYQTHRMAARMYGEAVNRDPSFALACARLSLVHSELYTMRMHQLPQNHLDSARILLEKARAIDPNLPEVHAAHGLFLIIKALDIDGAIQQYQKALEAEPGNSEAFERMGHAYLYMREFQKADAHYERAYELDPHGRRAIESLGFSYLAQRRWDEAEKLFSKSTALFPEVESGYIRRAKIHLSGYGDPEGARRILEEGLQHVPKPARWSTSRSWKAEIYSRDYERALAVLGNETNRELSRAMTYRYMGRMEKARAYFDSARVDAEEQIKRWPNTTMDYWFLGVAFAGLGMKAEAIASGRHRVDTPAHDIIWPERSELRLARIYVMVGEQERAIDALQSLLSTRADITVWDLRLDPMYDSLRNHPRFKKLVGAAE